MLKSYHTPYDIVGSKTLTASRTVTLEISDWAALEEIRQYRDINEVKDALRYCIRAEFAMILAKRELAHESPIKLSV